MKNLKDIIIEKFVINQNTRSTQQKDNLFDKVQAVLTYWLCKKDIDKFGNRNERIESLKYFQNDLIELIDWFSKKHGSSSLAGLDTMVQKLSNAKINMSKYELMKFIDQHNDELVKACREEYQQMYADAF